jgi:hypothetical protein
MTCVQTAGYILKFVQIIFNDPVPTSQETHYASIIKISRLMVFSEIIVAYPENYDPCFLDLGTSWR